MATIYDCDLSHFDGGEVAEISDDEDEELREPMSVREAKRYDQAAFDRVSPPLVSNHGTGQVHSEPLGDPGEPAGP